MKHVHTDNAPKVVGPYSQAIITENLVFCAGQIAINPETGKLEGENITEQTQQVMKNITAVLEEAGCSLDNIVKTTCFLANMKDYADFNAAYEKALGNHKPARSAVEVAQLPIQALIEIEVIAEI
jgi:2-iminobutanoate/2-iminopropanoate deaminase